MKLSTLSGAAFLACGSSVYGRPLSTQQKRRGFDQNSSDLGVADLEPITPLYTGLQTSSGQFSPGTSMVFVPPSSPVILDTSTTNFETHILGLITPDSPPSEQTTRFGTPRPYADVIGPYISAAPIANAVSPDVISQSQPASSSETVPGISANLEGILLTMGDNAMTWCFFELTNDRVSLSATTDNSKDLKFKDVFIQASPGIALYHKGSHFFSVMNLHNRCTTKDKDGKLSGLIKDCQDEQILANAQTPWRAQVDKAGRVFYLTESELNGYGVSYDIQDFKDFDPPQDPSTIS